MPHKKDRAAKRKEWDEKAMELAIQEVREKKMGYLKVENMLKAPQTTLFRLATLDMPSNKACKTTFCKKNCSTTKNGGSAGRIPVEYGT
jgi:hypothetical protein